MADVGEVRGTIRLTDQFTPALNKLALNVVNSSRMMEQAAAKVGVPFQNLADRLNVVTSSGARAATAGASIAQNWQRTQVIFRMTAAAANEYSLGALRAAQSTDILVNRGLQMARAQGVMQRMAAEARELSAAMSSGEKSSGRFASAMNALGGFARQGADKLLEFGQSVIGGSRALGALSSGLTLIGGAAGATALAAIVGITAVFIKMANAIKQVIDALLPMGLQMEAIVNRLRFASLGAEGASRSLAFLRNNAQSLGIDLLSSADAFAQFSAAARNSTLSASETERVFSAVSKAVAVLRLDAGQTQGVFLALEQMISRGFVSMEELRRQLGNRLPGAFQIAAKAMGVTTGELQKLVAEGNLLTDDFLPKFATELEKTFAGAAVEASQSAFAGINRFHNSLFELRQTIATAFLPAVADLTNELAKLITLLKDTGAPEVFGRFLGILIKQVDALVKGVRILTPGLETAAKRMQEAKEETELFDKAVKEITASFIDLDRATLQQISSEIERVEGQIKALQRQTFFNRTDADRAQIRLLQGQLEQLETKAKEVEESLEFDVDGKGVREELSLIERALRSLKNQAEETRVAVQDSVVPFGEDIGALQLMRQLKGLPTLFNDVNKASTQWVETLSDRDFVTFFDEMNRLTAEGEKALREWIEAQGELRLDALGEEAEAAKDGLKGLRDSIAEQRKEAELNEFGNELLSASLDKIAENAGKAELQAKQFSESFIEGGKGIFDSAEDFARVSEVFDQLFPVQADIDNLNAVARELTRIGDSGRLTAEQLLMIQQILSEIENIKIEIEAEIKFREQLEKIQGVAEGLQSVFSNLADLFSQMGDDSSARIAQALVQMVASAQTLAIATAAAAASGWSFAAAMQAAAGVIGIIVAALAVLDVFGGEKKPEQTTEIFTFPGQGSGADITQLSTGGADLATQQKETMKALNEFIEGLREASQQLQQVLGFELPTAIDSAVKSVTAIGDKFVVTIDGIKFGFATLEEAIGFASQRFLIDAIAAGANIDTAIKQLTFAYSGQSENFIEAVERVQSLVDQADMSLEGLSQFEIELRKLPGQLDALAQELRELGLSSEQVTRLVGGQLVASFQRWRRELTGQDASIEDQRRMAQAQAELFNAEKELRIAELEARKQVLLAQFGLTEAQIDLDNARIGAEAQFITAQGQLLQTETQVFDNVINARSRFVEGSAKVFQAEVSVMAGFINAAGDVVKTGLEALGEEFIIRPPGEIDDQTRKLIESIQKIIDALKRIPDIKPGDISIPGTGGSGSAGGSGGASGPSLEDTIRDLIGAIMDDIAAQQDLVDALGEALGGLEKFLGDLRIGSPSPLTPGRQVDLLRAQLSKAAKAAEMGDLDAIQEFQRIAQTLRQVGAEAFGTAGSGFEALLSEIERLGGDILTDSNIILENQEDILRDIRSEFADMLLSIEDLHELSREEIKAIREGTDAETGGNISLLRELANGNKQTNKDLKALREVLLQLGRILADAA